MPAGAPHSQNQTAGTARHASNPQTPSHVGPRRKKLSKQAANGKHAKAQARGGQRQGPGRAQSGRRRPITVARAPKTATHSNHARAKARQAHHTRNAGTRPAPRPRLARHPLAYSRPGKPQRDGPAQQQPQKPDQPGCARRQNRNNQHRSMSAPKRQTVRTRKVAKGTPSRQPPEGP